ncbi:MAG: metal-sensitive transcriptional regulator [Bryobacterales bacterium]|nr:metal-sensitive transcriptional regulator [Bryobacterales bacterium]
MHNQAALKRLKKIEGQVRGLAKMVEDGRYCMDVLMQVAAVQQALRGVSRELMHQHLEHCVHNAVTKGDKHRETELYKEMLDLIYKYSR